MPAKSPHLVNPYVLANMVKPFNIRNFDKIMQPSAANRSIVKTDDKSCRSTFSLKGAWVAVGMSEPLTTSYVDRDQIPTFSHLLGGANDHDSSMDPIMMLILARDLLFRVFYQGRRSEWLGRLVMYCGEEEDGSRLSR
jgi:hypothetical protein